MQIPLQRTALRGLLITTMLTLAACGGGGSGAGTDGPPQSPTPGGDPATGTVGIFLTDGPSDRFDKILVRVSQVDLLGSGRPVTVFEGDVTIDLRQLETSGELLSLDDGVPAGSYSKIRLYIDDITLVDVDSDGETILEAVHPKIPANGKIELKPRGDLLVAAGETLLLQIDIDAEKSIKYHQTGNGEWRFRPVIMVETGDADDFARLTRMYGRISEIDGDTMSFLLCQTELLSDDDDSDDYGELEHCVSISVSDGTGLFGDSGDPIEFGALAEGDFATVAGLVQNEDDDYADIDEDSDSDSDVDSDSDDDSDSDGYHKDGAPFEIDAVVVMQGEKGTFRPYAGRVNDGLDTATGEFTIDLDPDQGIETDGPLLALYQDGTRIFDKYGMALEPLAIAPDVRGHFEGRLALSDIAPDVLKTALIVLDMAPLGDEVLRGDIATLNDGGFVLMTETGDRCVATDAETNVFLILPDEGNGIRSERGSLADLAAGQPVDVYGEEKPDGCFDADSVIVDLTVDAAPPANRAPVANAGADVTIDAGQSVMLDGSGSSDPDGDMLSYAWSLSAPDGSMAVLTAADTAMPSFTADVIGEYVAELTVDDGEFTDADSVVVNAIDPAVNQAPVADAGPDQAVDVGAAVTLDGTGSSDADGDTLAYSWMLETPMGSSAALDDATSAAPGFTADVAGTYRAVLVVSDGVLESAPDDVVITAEEVMPGPNGEQLYNDTCDGCHVPFADAPDWTANQIQEAIDRNRGGMGALDLSPGQIAAIADALAARP